MVLALSASAAIDRFSARVRRAFGDRIARLVLFGSRARGDAHEGSDIDILVVLDDLSAADGRKLDAISATSSRATTCSCRRCC